MIQIEYDRKAKQYRWEDLESGQVLTAPSGQKFQLFQAVVSMLDPDLYAAANRIIEAHPQLERGVWKAVEIVASEGVENFAGMKGDVYAMVDSSDGFGRYAITNEDGYMACQCENFQSFAAPMTQSGNRYCKHILAYQLHLATREERF